MRGRPVERHLKRALARPGLRRRNGVREGEGEENRVLSRRSYLPLPRIVRLNTSGVLMANDEHVAMLKKGVDAWNAWREKDPNIRPDLTGALLDGTGCRVHGVSAWGLKLERAKQQNLIITYENEPAITVDNIEVAQFI